MTKSFPANSCAEELGLQPEPLPEDSQQPPSSSAHEIMEIQKIQKSLMSDLETPATPTVTGASPLPPYSTVGSKCLSSVFLFVHCGCYCV